MPANCNHSMPLFVFLSPICRPEHFHTPIEWISPLRHNIADDDLDKFWSQEAARCQNQPGCLPLFLESSLQVQHQNKLLVNFLSTCTHTCVWNHNVLGVEETKKCSDSPTLPFRRNKYRVYKNMHDFVFLPCIFIQLYLFTETMNMPTIFYFSALVHKPVLEHSLLCFLQVAFYYKSVGTVPTTKHQVHFNWTVTYYRNKLLFKKQSAGLNLLH